MECMTRVSQLESVLAAAECTGDGVRFLLAIPAANQPNKYLCCYAFEKNCCYTLPNPAGDRNFCGFDLTQLCQKSSVEYAPAQ